MTSAFIREAILVAPTNFFLPWPHTHPFFSVSDVHYHCAWLLQSKSLPMSHNVFSAPQPHSLCLPCALNTGSEHQKTSSAWGVHSWKGQWMSCLLVWQSSCKQGSLQGVPSAVLAVGYDVNEMDLPWLCTWIFLRSTCKIRSCVIDGWGCWEYLSCRSLTQCLREGRCSTPANSALTAVLQNGTTSTNQHLLCLERTASGDGRFWLLNSPNYSQTGWCPRSPEQDSGQTPCKQDTGMQLVPW